MKTKEEILEIVEDLQVKLGGIGIINCSLSPTGRHEITKLVSDALNLSKKLYRELM